MEQNWFILKYNYGETASNINFIFYKENWACRCSLMFKYIAFLILKNIQDILKNRVKKNQTCKCQIPKPTETETVQVNPNRIQPANKNIVPMRPNSNSESCRIRVKSDYPSDFTLVHGFFYFIEKRACNTFFLNIWLSERLNIFSWNRLKMFRSAN